jgi:hypothetical protein
MFKQFENSTLEEITNHNGYEYQCWVPPLGYGVNTATGELEETEILKNGDDPLKHFFVRTEMPKLWARRLAEQDDRQRTDPDYYDPILWEFEKQEWGRRLRGVWFWKYDRKTETSAPVYITGLHYLYINWWKFQGKYNNFRTPDRKFFYVLDYCIEDPNCLGLIEFTKRKQGKTARAGVFLYEYISRSNEQHGGIQSKTDKDAFEVFKKAVVAPWRKLPYFFRPTFDTALGDNPKGELRFFDPSQKGKKALRVVTDEDEQALDSFIDFESRGADAYDGPELHRYVSDESGKLKDVSILDRHDVVMFCSEVDGKFVGKHLYTTTVEEMEAGGAEFLKLVQNSDPLKRNDLGRTISGLYTYFTPAQWTMEFDIYGDPDEEKAIAYFEARRKSLKDKPRQLSSFIRKNPMTFKEAFRVDGDKCLYNSMKLNDQLELLSWNEDYVERGNFGWENGVRDTKVIWKKDPNGRWVIVRSFLPKPEEVNNVKRLTKHFEPLNDIRFGSGCDTFDHDQTEDNSRQSRGASLVKQKNNPYNFDDPLNGAYVCMYLARPNTAPLFYEDMIMQCFYFSCKILAETNKPGILNYFRNRGYAHFLVHLPGYKEPGVPSTPENKQMASELLEVQIEDHADKIFFTDLIDDCLLANLKKTQPFDIFMAALWTELSCSVKYLSKPADEKVKDIRKYLRKYKIRQSA